MPKINHVPLSPTLLPLLFDNSAEFWRWAEDPTLNGTGQEFPFAVNGDPSQGTDDYRQIIVDPDDVIVETQPRVRVEDSGLSDKAIEEFARALEENGQISPILLRICKTPDTYVNPANPDEGTNPGEFQYHLVAGLRRVLAARAIKRRQEAERAAGIAAGKPESELPVVEFNLLAVIRVVANEAVAKQLAVSENVDREEMSALEKYAMYKPHLDAHRRPNGNVNVQAAADSAGIGRTQMAAYDRIDSLYGKPGEEEFTAMFNSGQFNFDVADALSKLSPEERKAKLVAAKQVIGEKVMAKAAKAAKAAQESVMANPVVAELPPDQAKQIAEAAAKQAAAQAAADASAIIPGKTTPATITTQVLKEAETKVAGSTVTAKKMSTADFVKLLETEVNPALVSPQVIAWRNLLISRLRGEVGEEMDNGIVRGLFKLFRPEHIIETVVTPAPAKGKAAVIAPPPAPATAPAGPAPAPPVPPRRPAAKK